VDAAALTSAAAIPHYRTNSADTTKVQTMLQSHNGTASHSNTVMSADPGIALTDTAFVTYANRTLTKPAISVIRTNGIEVEKTYTVPNLFTGIFPNAGTDVTVRATAVIGAPACMIPDIPLALVICDDENGPGLCSRFNCNTSMIIQFPAGNALHSGGNIENAAFYAIGLTNNGNPQQPDAPYCQNTVNNGVGVTICSGDKINLNNGQVNACLMDIKQKCDAKKAEPTPSCVVGNPWNVVIPLIHCGDLVTNTPVQAAWVAGFARIGITDADFTGSPKTIDMTLTCDMVVQNAHAGGLECGLTAQAPFLAQ
jgi:hypothetical protein